MGVAKKCLRGVWPNFVNLPFICNTNPLITYLYSWMNKYSRVQKNWNEVFFKILEEPSIVQKKMIPHIKGLDFSQRWSKKKIKMADLENSIWPPQKNSFSSSANSQYFFMKISWIGPWVNRIDWWQVHCCDLTYVIVRLSDIHCFWAYVGQPHDHISWDISMPFASINSTNPRPKP